MINGLAHKCTHDLIMRIQCVKDIPQTPRITLDRAFNSSMESISCHEAVPGNKLFDGDLVKLDKLRVHGCVENLIHDTCFLYMAYSAGSVVFSGAHLAQSYFPSLEQLLCSLLQ